MIKNIEIINTFGTPPSKEEQIAAIEGILGSVGDIYHFRSYHWLTKKPVPPRHDRQTNNEYISRHWWRLRKAAQEWAKSLDEIPK